MRVHLPFTFQRCFWVYFAKPNVVCAEAGGQGFCAVPRWPSGSEGARHAWAAPLLRRCLAEVRADEVRAEQMFSATGATSPAGGGCRGFVRA